MIKEIYQCISLHISFYFRCYGYEEGEERKELMREKTNNLSSSWHGLLLLLPVCENKAEVLMFPGIDNQGETGDLSSICFPIFTFVIVNGSDFFFFHYSEQINFFF